MRPGRVAKLVQRLARVDLLVLERRRILAVDGEADVASDEKPATPQNTAQSRHAVVIWTFRRARPTLVHGSPMPR
jgi:hypothetical protein